MWFEQPVPELCFILKTSWRCNFIWKTFQFYFEIIAILFWKHCNFIASLATELIGSLYSGWEVVAKKGTKANQNNQTKKGTKDNQNNQTKKGTNDNQTKNGTKANKFVFRQVASLISAWESSGDELKDDQGKNHLHVHLWSTQYDCFRLWGTSVFQLISVHKW